MFRDGFTLKLLDAEIVHIRHDLMYRAFNSAGEYARCSGASFKRKVDELDHAIDPAMLRSMVDDVVEAF
jgi:hypothetical protein